MCGAGNFGQASWQANSGESLGIGQGIYSGAVNQKLFGGTLNSAGQPGCGTGCGVCYELMTTGVNAYNDGTPGGSTIQIMVVVRQIDPASRPVLYRADISSPFQNYPGHNFCPLKASSTKLSVPQDACYNNAGSPNWCSSNTASGSDDFGCDVHFE